VNSFSDNEACSKTVVNESAGGEAFPGRGRPAITFFALILSTLICFPGGLYAQAQESRIAVTGAVDWKKMEITVNTALDLVSAGIRLPTGRARAEDIITAEFASLLWPYILAVPVDSSSTVEDLLRLGQFPYLRPETFAGSARRGQAAFTPDFTSLSASYTLDLSLLSGRLILHNQAAEIRRVPVPVQAASYSGIIIIASGELPVHGRRTGSFALPCLFPKVWDTDMNLIYDKNTLDPDSGGKTLVYYAAEADIFRDSPSGLSPELAARVGDNPLRLIASGVFGIRPTDPRSHREDALIILSSEDNRRLLREGKVAIVLSDDALSLVPVAAQAAP
jgi:hypothetical protein